MKKTGKVRLSAAITFAALAVTTLGSCGNKTVYGNVGLVECAQEEYSNTTLTLNGTAYNRGETLAWFRGDPKISDRCEAASFRNTDDNGFVFIGDEAEKTEAKRIWSCKWHGGIVYHIENPDCKTVSFTVGKDVSTVTLAETPFTFFYPLNGSADPDVDFLTEQGKRIGL